MPRAYKDLGLCFFRRNLVKVSIFYSELNYENISEDPVYTVKQEQLTGLFNEKSLKTTPETSFEFFVFPLADIRNDGRSGWNYGLVAGSVCGGALRILPDDS